MDGVVHNPDILQVSNEADLSTGVDTINSVEHNVYMEKRAENQEAGYPGTIFSANLHLVYLFVLPQLLSATIAFQYNQSIEMYVFSYFVKLFNRNLFYAGLRFEQLEPTAFRN